MVDGVVSIRAWASCSFTLWDCFEANRRAAGLASMLGDGPRWEDKIFIPAQRALHDSLRGTVMDAWYGIQGGGIPDYMRSDVVKAAVRFKKVPDSLLAVLPADLDDAEGPPSQMADDLRELIDPVLAKVRAMLRGEQIHIVRQATHWRWVEEKKPPPALG